VKRLVCLAASAVVSCSSIVLIGGLPASAGAAAATDSNGALIRSAVPPGFRRTRGVADDMSSNWSGYAQVSSTPGTFTEVSDTFVVPTVATDVKGRQFVADWVGIGGYDEPTLVQTGIQAMVSTRRHRRVVSYDAWTEHLPQAEKPLKLVISAGDTVTATVQETSLNVWTMDVVDDTTTLSAGVTDVSYKSSGESAEAISERPCLRAPCANHDLAQLAQTPPITFAPGSFSTTPVGQVPAAFPLLETMDPSTGISLIDIIMTNNTDTTAIATPSGPDAADDGFDVADGASQPLPPSI
jgi:hypothetical protein